MTKKKKSQYFPGKKSPNPRQPVKTTLKHPELNRYYQDTFDFVNRQSKIVVFAGIPILFIVIYLLTNLMGEIAPGLLPRYFLAAVSILSIICAVFLIMGLAGKVTVNFLGGDLSTDQKNALRQFTFRLGFVILSSQIFVYNAKFHWFDTLISYFSWSSFQWLIKEAQITTSNIINWIMSATVGNLFWSGLTRVLALLKKKN